MPDLAFSEMTFLTSRRERPKDSFEDTSNRPSDKKKQWKSTKALDTEAEFSRYFTSVKPATLGVISPHGQRGPQTKRRTRDHESPQAYVDLPDRPFLGFGSCGPNTSISPAKIAINTGSRGLRSGDTRSSTRSTSYLTWSQSEGPSYASPLPDRRHHIEPLASSKLSNRKRVSQDPHESQRSMSPVSPPCGQRKFLGTQGAVSKPSSEHENPCKDLGQISESRLATGERLRSREKSQDHHDTRTTGLDAAKAPQNIDDSVHDKTYPAEASGHGGPEPVLPSRNQAACRFSGHEPRCEPQAHDTRPLSAQMPTISPHEDPLDDILETLLRDCNTKVANSDLFPRATPIHRNSNDGEEARIPDRIKQRSRIPTHVHFNSIYSPENPASAFHSSRKPGSAGHQQACPHADPKSTHKLSRARLNSPNRPNLGYNLSYPSVPTHNQVDSRNAWNGYDNLYERQHEQEAFTPETSREQIRPYTAVQEDVSGPSRETGHSAGPSEYAPGLHPVEVGDDFEDDNCQKIRHDGWGDQHIDYGTFYDSGASIPDESHEGFDSGITAQNHVNDYQERERLFAQGADQHENEQQLFTANVSDTYPSWRSHRLSGSNHGLERCAVDGQVQEVDPILSGFWTPHKLY